jgi:hypothetical protein
MRKALLVLALAVPAIAAVPYAHVQSTAEVTTSPVSRFVSVHVHLRNFGGIATSCVVKAGGQRRVTGISVQGEADVSFDALASYKGYTVACSVN